MGTLRTPLVGLLFCVVALLPLATLAQEVDYGFYGDDFSWIQDVQPVQLAEDQSLWSDPLWNTTELQTPVSEQGWDYAGFENIDWNIAEPEIPAPGTGWDYSWFEDVDWNITEQGIPTLPAPEQGWDYSGFENIEQYAVISPTELFQPYESLIGPLFTTPGGETDGSSLTPWGETESQDQGWFEFYRTDDALQAQQLEFEAAQRAADEFNRSDDALWAEQLAWEERQAREQAFIDATLDTEAAAWQYKGVDKLNAGDVEIAQEQERQDRRDAAAPDREPVPLLKQLQALFAPLPAPAESQGPSNQSPEDTSLAGRFSCVWGAEDCTPFSLKVTQPTLTEEQQNGPSVKTELGKRPENVAPTQPSEESTFDRLTRDPAFGFFLKTVPDAYDATKERLTGWYDSLTNSVAPAPQVSAFADRFQAENSVWNTDPAAQEALLKEWASRTDVDTRFSTREALPPLGVGSGSGTSAPFPQAEQSMFDGALPFGMSASDGRLEVNRDTDAQSPQEFEEYKKYNLITEAKRYANTTYPIIVDFGDKAVVLRGEDYGLEGNGIGVVRGNNLGNFNFGWDTTVGQKAENTFVSGFQGYEDEGATARRFLARVDPETNRTVGQDVAKEIGKFESEKSFLGRVGDSIGFGPSTVSVEGFTQSGDKFFAQDLVGPYDKNEPPKEPEKKEILMEVGIVMEPIKIPESVAPQVVSETPAAPPASVSADPLPPADTPESPQSVAPPPEAVEVGRMDVKEIAPPLPDISGADPLPCSLCSKEAETPSPLPMPELVPPEEAPQRETTGTEKKILGDLQEPVTNTPETPAEQDLIDKLKTSGVAAPSAADRREISEIIQGRPKTDVEVNFALDSALIDDRAKTGLSQIGGVLSREEFKGRTIFINGHSDAFGGPEYNLALSQRRAEAIKQYLVNEFNLDPDRIIAVGFGREQLKYPNSPYASGNRRVQIVITR